MNHQATYDAITAYLAGKGLAVKVIRKRSSALMWVIAVILFPFNRRFMSNYTTTFAGRMWVPDGFDTQTSGAWRTLAHEGVHRAQAVRYGEVPFGLAYLFPLPLALLAFGALGAFWTPWAWLFLVALVALGPWPAPGRVEFEREAYLMTAVCDALVGIDIASQDYLDYQVEHHCGWGYYKPAWNRARTEARIREDLAQAARVVAGEASNTYYTDMLTIIRAQQAG